MTAPVVVPAPELNAKFDPRTGNTGNWLGSDVARSVPFGDGRMLWIFADTYKRVSGSGTPTSRSGTVFVNDSLAIQHGPDLATAEVTFHFAATPSGNWFPVSEGYITWPSDGIFIGNDLYVTGTRVLKSDPLGGEYGWTLHKVANAKVLPVSSWVATLLYESGDTGTRPMHSPYISNGYVYIFTIKRVHPGGGGWIWSRWTLADFTGVGTQGAVQFYTGAGWSTDAEQAFVISKNPVNADGSVHQRAFDGRWIITDEVGEFPLFKGSIRLAAKDGAGNYPVAGIGGYQPPPPAFAVGDRVKKDGLFNATILALSGSTATIEFTPFWGGATETASTSALTLDYRITYENPRHYEDPLPPDYWTYAYRAHPHLQSSNGLIVSYVDNGQLAGPLDIYWPKFYRVLPPTVSGLAVTGEGLVSWTSGGGPDRMRIRVAGGSWVELDALATSYQLDGYVPGQSVEVQAIGIGGATSRTVRGVIDDLPSAGQPPKPPSSSDWLIWPREPNLSRSHDPLSGWTRLVLVERHNSPSTWIVTAPTAQMAAFTAGSGCVLDRDGVQIASGQATSVEWDQETDTMTVAFASDLVRLGWRIAQPNPAQLLTPAISKFTAAYDLRTGPIEDLILGYTRSNLGNLALPSRREARLRVPPSLGRGGTTQVSARLDNLGVLVQSLAEAGNLRVDIAHAEDAGGAWLDMTVEPVANLSNDVRFGDRNSTATGLVRNAQYGLMLPTTTRAIVALGGDLADREFLQLINASAETLWAAVVETVVDQRNIDPTSLDKLAEATRAGQEALAAGAEPRQISFESMLGPDLEYRRDVRVGDIVGYDLPGLAPAQDKIREATTTVSVESGQPTERVQVVIGTPDAPATRTQQQTARALRSINQIQRSK